MRKLPIKNREEREEREKSEQQNLEKREPSEPKCLLDAFENIVEWAKGSELNENFYTKCDSSIGFIKERLGITDVQAIFLAIFVDRSEDNHIRPSELANFIGIRTVRMLKYMEDIEGLARLRYIRISNRRDDLHYSVPIASLKALQRNEPYIYEVEEIKDTQEFFDRMVVLMREKKHDEIDYNQLMRNVKDMLVTIKDTAFAQRLERYCLDEDLQLLFIFMAHLFIENDDDSIRFHDIEDLYDNDDIPTWVKRGLRKADNELFEQGLIENANEDGMARTDAFKLTESAKENLLGELTICNGGKSDQGMLKHNTLAERKLIYNPKEGRLVKELSSILSVERFKEVQARLKESGMRSGFCCLFYGTPGTGKTETVYQIAKSTGRDILQVDVDKIKSCWVGESEKNIKALFDRYRNICKTAERLPILLFNEADAVLGVRMEGASRAVDKMENSIQNIILQEMEKLDGIMLATTNLTTNLDKAFERRFLYKIRFEKPTVEARAGIWQAMMPGLKKKEALYLAGQFDLSGGEIENVVRRHTVQSILKGTKRIDIKAIEDSCRVERLSDDRHVRIGF